MGSCCSSSRRPKKSGLSPTVVIVGASGYVGKFVTQEFLAALNDDRLKELRVLSTKRSDPIQDFERQGAKLFVGDYTNLPLIIAAFTGVDVVVSTLGAAGPGIDETRNALLTAMVKAGVKIYFPSEFGTNHYTRVKNYKHPIFEGKKEHFEEAQAKGLTTIRIVCSAIMEFTFEKLLGMDTDAEVWTLIGKGETPVAVTAEKDIGRFTVEATLMAYDDPTNTPDLIEVYSDIRTLKEYAEAFDKVAGRPTKLEFIPLDQALAHYESTQQDIKYLLQILFEEGTFNTSDAKGNELLNPGERLWKLKKIEEYADETGGRP